MNNLEIHNKIMVRVRTVNLIKQTSRIGIKLLIIAICVGISSLFVSYENVFANVSGVSAFDGLLAFTISAITKTEIVVQLIGFIIVLASYLLVRDILKNILSIFYFEKIIIGH